MLYDALLVIALLMVAAAIVVIPTGGEVRSGTLWFQLYLLFVWWAYFGTCWRIGGQTVGMKAWRVRLYDDRWQRVGWTATILRFVMAALSAAVVGAGYIWSVFDAERRTWHDMASRTQLHVLPRKG